MHYRLTTTLVLALAAATLGTGCTSRTISTSPVEPSVANTPFGSATTQSQKTLAGSWHSVAIRPTAVPTAAVGPSGLGPVSCGSFAWSGTPTSSTDVSGNFTALCNGSVQVSGTGNGHLDRDNNATITASGSGQVPGFGTCEFSIQAQGPLVGDNLQITFTGTSCGGVFSGQETLRRGDIFPDPSPAADPPPSGGETSGSGDELKFSSVQIVLGSDISNWAVTDSMLQVTRTGTTLCTYHSKAGQWPRLPWFGDSSVEVEGNQWMFAYINGQWYGAAGEWLRPGQVCKDVGDHVGSGAFYSTIMGNWTPAPGELIGLAVSTPARAGQWGTAERSNTVFFRW